MYNNTHRARYDSIFAWMPSGLPLSLEGLARLISYAIFLFQSFDNFCQRSQGLINCIRIREKFGNIRFDSYHITPLSIFFQYFSRIPSLKSYSSTISGSLRILFIAFPLFFSCSARTYNSYPVASSSVSNNQMIDHEFLYFPLHSPDSIQRRT
jgi:hypothetical protein